MRGILDFLKEILPHLLCFIHKFARLSPSDPNGKRSRPKVLARKSSFHIRKPAKSADVTSLVNINKCTATGTPNVHIWKEIPVGPQTNSLNIHKYYYEILHAISELLN